ncbi:MAG TPA: dTDP-4-dehydrorhamnose 3,5-epimerase family protein [Planctomycetota bacterium]|nr:dTDP-4-dehydrorhamnose 3,5-epimerase family protein [Planctomycetota bacterium]
MRFVPLEIPGAFLVKRLPSRDERGSFARSFCAAEFAAHGLDPRVAQCSFSHNPRRGTLRGMHYQEAPHEEAKLVCCLRGGLHDVIVDLRPGSPALRRWVAVPLSADDDRSLYVPPGCAHGFLTLQDDTLVLYQMSTPYVPGVARGVRWDDPALGIDWPARPSLVSKADSAYPLLA